MADLAAPAIVADGPDPADGQPTSGAVPGVAWAHVRLVAGVTFRDLLRRPGGWVATLLTALLFALLVGSVGLSNDRVQDRVEARTFRVVMGGDVDGAAKVVEQLDAGRLALERVDPARGEVSDEVTNGRASAGIWFPDDTDAHLDAGEAVEVKLYSRQSASLSVEAVNLVSVRLQEIELLRLADANGTTISTGGGPDVQIEELPRDERLNRLQLARQLAPIAALLCIGAVTSVAAVLGAAREKRSIEPLLVLPMTRRSISAGVALGAFPLAALQIVAAVLLLVLTAAVPGSSLHQSVPTLLAMGAAGAASALLLALVAAGCGNLAGALGTGTDDAVSLGDLVAVLFVVVGVVTFSMPTLGGNPLLYAVPILGQDLLMRDAVSGSFAPLDILLATASAIVTFVVLVRIAGDRLDEERRIARATH